MSLQSSQDVSGRSPQSTPGTHCSAQHSSRGGQHSQVAKPNRQSEGHESRAISHSSRQGSRHSARHTLVQSAQSVPQSQSPPPAHSPGTAQSLPSSHFPSNADPHVLKQRSTVTVQPAFSMTLRRPSTSESMKSSASSVSDKTSPNASRRRKSCGSARNA